MILLAGATIVLPDRLLERGSVLIDAGRIVAIEPRTVATPSGATRVDLAGAVIVPGFIDVHVHGVEGHDVLDGAGAIGEVARRLPRYGVTAFCPTSIACDPAALTQMLREVGESRAVASGSAARVLPAHLESNFINPEFKGAQPVECLRVMRPSGPSEGAFTGDDILTTIEQHRSSVAIVTVAPELPGGIDLVKRLSSTGLRVSLGHTGATYEEALAAIDAGACHATHLFNRMTAMTHRAPGAPGAILGSPRVTAEVICDGFHVHPALVSVAVRTKGPAGIMAITDGTAGSGLPVGSRTRLGGRPIVVTNRTAELEDGTMAGSVLTMDGAFRMLVRQAGASLVDAARMCSTTPAEQLGVRDAGRIALGATADLVVLDSELRVRTTYVSGRAWPGTQPGAATSTIF